MTKARSNASAPAAKGQIVVGTGTDTSGILAVGSANQVLTVDSSTATGLKWAAPAGGGGKILQVVQGTTTAFGNSTSSTYADTGLTASITPSATSSKVLVLVSQQIAAIGNGSSHAMAGLQIVRNSTVIQTMEYLVGQVSGTFSLGVPASLVFLDSPNTTSATTYKTQFARNTSVGNAYVNNGANPSTIVLLEVSA